MTEPYVIIMVYVLLMRHTGHVCVIYTMKVSTQFNMRLTDNNKYNICTAKYKVLLNMESSAICKELAG